MDLQIHMCASATLVFILRIFTTSIPLAATVPYNFTIAKRNCNDKCGNISIPFPFGTSKECYLADEFLINCNRSSPDNPRAFLTDSQIEVTSISLDGQLTVLQSIAYQCPGKQDCTCVNVASSTSRSKIKAGYSTQTTRSNDFLSDYDVNTSAMRCTCIDKEGQSWINLETFTVNNTANKLTVAGCDTNGFVSGKLRGNRNFKTGCSSTCGSKSDIENGTCNGLGCCQTSFPKHVRRVDLQLTSNDNYTYVKDFNYCGFAFVVDQKAFNFSSDALSTLMNVSRLPMVVDWGIINGNGSCKRLAYKKPTYYACKSENSTCYHPDNGDGYRCACMNGYQGNPYLVNGCQDIDECQDPALNHCGENRCKNTQGSYECFCHDGGSIRDYCSPTLKLVVVLDSPTKKTDQNETTLFPSKWWLIVARKAQSKRGIARHSVKLLGCCLETRVPLLIYEFITNGTLSQHIHNEAKARLLSWDMRLRIAAETAGVLSYLHSAASTPIIHRDMKSTNILLDHNFTAKVSDFGASKLFPLDKTELTTLVQGTFGYLDPEFFRTSQLTEKSDVYSFGVVLVELLTGRKAVSNDRPQEERSLANHFLSVVKEQHLLFRILDNKIVKEGDQEVVMKVAHVAKRCLNVKGDERPYMKEVERELEGLRVDVKRAKIIQKYSALDEESVVGDYEFNSFTTCGDSSTSSGFHSHQSTLLVGGGR